MSDVATHRLSFIVPAIFWLLLVGCAQQGPPQGGPPDIAPPTVISNLPASGDVLVPRDASIALDRALSLKDSAAGATRVAGLRYAKPAC